MKRIKSNLSTKTPVYKENFDNSKQIIKELKDNLKIVKVGGPKKRALNTLKEVSSS